MYERVSMLTCTSVFFYGRHTRIRKLSLRYMLEELFYTWPCPPSLHSRSSIRWCQNLPLWENINVIKFLEKETGWKSRQAKSTVRKRDPWCTSVYDWCNYFPKPCEEITKQPHAHVLLTTVNIHSAEELISENTWITAYDLKLSWWLILIKSSWAIT
jgi:hypothetical protein